MAKQIFECKQCDEQFENYPSQTSGFCSRECYWQSMQGKDIPHLDGKRGVKNTGCFDNGHVPWNKGTRPLRDCSSCGEEFVCMTLTQKFCSKGCATAFRMVGIEFSLETRKNMSLAQTGEEEFTDFKRTESYRLRRSKAYREWRENIYIRDDYTCQECGARGGYLEAHHIKPFAKYPEQRFDLDNGITLCKDCHIKIDDKRHGRIEN